MGYDLTHLNANNDHFDALREERIPYCVIVKKHYPNRRRIQNRRKWKLQQLAKVADGGASKKDEERAAADYEMFMRDLEEDPELRANVNLYRDEHVPADQPVPHVTDDGELVEDDFPEVSLDEMLNALTLDDHDPALASEHAAVGTELERFAIRDTVDAMEH
jgi:nonsense-mediated mRNA decay protein 3